MDRPENETISLISQTADGSYLCLICGKRSMYKQNLKQHIEGAHTSCKPFECKICGKIFKQKNSLKRHIEAIHRGIKPFVCTTCGKSFSQNGQLKLHIQSIHARMKPFACNACGRTFSQNSNLKRHVQSLHAEIRPFACEHCGKRWAEKSLLKRHLRSHEVLFDLSALKTDPYQNLFQLIESSKEQPCEGLQKQHSVRDESEAPVLHCSETPFVIKIEAEDIH